MPCVRYKALVVSIHISTNIKNVRVLWSSEEGFYPNSVELAKIAKNDLLQK